MNMIKVKSNTKQMRFKRWRKNVHTTCATNVDGSLFHSAGVATVKVFILGGCSKSFFMMIWDHDLDKTLHWLLSQSD